jgi:hypothetical protein
MNNLEIELNNLFEKWKEEHEKDILYEYDTPGIDEKLIPRENFVEDGFCVSEVIKENTILYISQNQSNQRFFSKKMK